MCCIYESSKYRKNANKSLFKYYKKILKKDSTKLVLKNKKRKRLLWLCKVGNKEVKELPLDKTSRWIGYIQGVLIENNIISINSEREFTRPIFHKAYRKDNIKIPGKKSYK